MTSSDDTSVEFDSWTLVLCSCCVNKYSYKY